jgi:hypothetical protein
MGTLVAGLADGTHKINLNVDLHTRALITADMHQHLLHEGRFFRTAQQARAMQLGDTIALMIDPTDHGDRVHIIATIWATKAVRLRLYEGITREGGVQIPLLQTNRDTDYKPYSEVYIDVLDVLPMNRSGGTQVLDVPLNLAICDKGITAEFFLEDQVNFWIELEKEDNQPTDVFMDIILYEHEHYVPPGS